MKLGVFLVVFSNEKFEQALDRAKSLGLDSVEIGTGNYPGNAHCKPAELLKSQSKISAFKDAVVKRGLEISALSCHGNALHPDKKFAKENTDTLKQTILLAEKLGVKNVVDFSGCPGDGPKATKPNWVTCPWPPDFTEIVNWQWEKVAIPFWKDMAKFAADHGVRICFEMHPGFLVYSAETLLKMRKECGKNIGANFDPSHLFWQGMDPIACLRAIGSAVYHVHAKDCRIDQFNVKTMGVLDTKPYGDEINRSWIFRTVGYGHGEDFWRDFISTLRLIGYDGTISIEHEDSLMSGSEGFTKAVDFLKSVILKEKSGPMYWA